MREVKVLVLRSAGTNCDKELAAAWEYAGAKPELRHVNELVWPEATVKLDDYDILAVPGGFAYGDDLGAGKLLANDLIYRLGEKFQKFVESGKPVLGVCNGFQVLAKAGLFGDITLTDNSSNQFECRWVELDGHAASRNIFTRGIERMYLPVAHGEGRVVARDETTLDQLSERGQIPLTYATDSDNSKLKTQNSKLNNPNGSVANIAGLCNATGTVFGLMPHPERFISPLQHPHWTRLPNLPAEGDGAAIFKNAVRYVQQEL